MLNYYCNARVIARTLKNLYSGGDIAETTDSLKTNLVAYEKNTENDCYINDGSVR